MESGTSSFGPSRVIATRSQTLVHQVSDSLYAVAYRILRDAGLAEDALQDALVTSCASSEAASSTCSPGARALRSVGPPDPRSRLLCGGPAQPPMGRTIRVLPAFVVRRTGRAGRTPRHLRPRQSSTARSAGCRSTSGPSSSTTTTSDCPWSRSPSCSASRPGRPARDSTTQPGRSGRRSRSTRPRPPTPRRTTGMSNNPTFDRTARIWLEDGPGEAPDAVLQAALLAIETTPMERDLRIPWRFPPIIRSSLAAVAIVAVVAVGGVAIWRNQSQALPVGGLTPTASPSPATAPHRPPPAPTAAPSQSALAVAFGDLVPGTRYQATQLSQPMTFLMPAGFAPTGASAIADPSADGHTFRVWGRPVWAVTIHDDALLAKDAVRRVVRASPSCHRRPRRSGRGWPPARRPSCRPPCSSRWTAVRPPPGMRPSARTATARPRAPRSTCPPVTFIASTRSRRAATHPRHHLGKRPRSQRQAHLQSLTFP